MAIGVAFGSTIYHIEGARAMSAFILALGIGIQNFPEGSAISLPLRREGFSRIKAFIFGSLSGIVEILAWCAAKGLYTIALDCLRLHRHNRLRFYAGRRQYRAVCNTGG
mgnify:CR=1 FL=1